MIEVKEENIVRISSPDISEERIIETINEFLETGEKVFLTTHLISKALVSEKEYQNFNRKELVWLLNNIKLIKQITDSKIAATIFYILLKNKAETIHQISKSMGSFTSPIRWWINKFSKSNIILSHSLLNGQGNINYYGINHDELPNIINLISSRILYKYGVESLKKGSTINQDKQYKAIRDYIVYGPKKYRK